MSRIDELTSLAFRVPAALDGRGRIVGPDDARKGAAYRCPACESPVDLHAGEKKRRHFHHRAGTCTAESVLHLCAKEMIAQAVTDWLTGGPAVTFARRCAHEACDATCAQAIPPKVAGVALERALPSGHVVDVALLARGRGDDFLPLPIAAIEVHHTHAVGARKTFEMGIPWIEVDAAQVCASSGRELVVVTDRFLPWLCEEHASERGSPRRAAREERATAAALARKLPFDMADFPGFRIGGVSKCGRGHEALVFAWDGKEPPWPRPPLVVAVQNDFDWTKRGAARAPTKTLAYRRSYASACAACGEVIDPKG